MFKLFANWKMYLDMEESKKLADKITEMEVPENVDLAVFPNHLAFCEVSKKLQKEDIDIGAQNVAWTPKGAYTGAVSALMFKQAGAKFALVGHSERRHIFGETNEATAKKTQACLEEGITPVLCIGETKEDLEQGDRELILGEQLTSVFDNIEQDFSSDDIIIGYEPVWAIAGSGEGESCSPKLAEEVHSWIKEKVSNYFTKEVDVLYGGSVESDNIASYSSLKSVDGILSGHASANFEELSALFENIEV